MIINLFKAFSARIDKFHQALVTAVDSILEEWVTAVLFVPHIRYVVWMFGASEFGGTCWQLPRQILARPPPGDVDCWGELGGDGLAHCLDKRGILYANKQR